MRSAFAHDLYSTLEIAQAAGVPEADVLAALGGTRARLPHDEAVRVGTDAGVAGRHRDPAIRG